MQASLTASLNRLLQCAKGLGGFVVSKNGGFAEYRGVLVVGRVAASGVIEGQFDLSRGHASRLLLADLAVARPACHPAREPSGPAFLATRGWGEKGLPRVRTRSVPLLEWPGKSVLDGGLVPRCRWSRGGQPPIRHKRLAPRSPLVENGPESLHLVCSRRRAISLPARSRWVPAIYSVRALTAAGLRWRQVVREWLAVKPFPCRNVALKFRKATLLPTRLQAQLALHYYRHPPKQPSDWLLRLHAQVERLSHQYPRLGYRKLVRLLRQEGWQVGRKQGAAHPARARAEGEAVDQAAPTTRPLDRHHPDQGTGSKPPSGLGTSLATAPTTAASCASSRCLMNIPGSAWLCTSLASSRRLTSSKSWNNW